MIVRLSPLVALLLSAGPVCSQAEAAAQHGFELILPASVTVPAGGRQSFLVALKIPEGFYITRDAELDVPRLEVAGVGADIEVEPGPEAEPESKAGEQIYRGRYTRTVTVAAVAGAAAEPGRLSVSLRFVSCDASLCYPPWVMRGSFALAVGEPGSGEVTYGTVSERPVREPRPVDRSLHYSLVALAVGAIVWYLLRRRR